MSNVPSHNAHPNASPTGDDAPSLSKRAYDPRDIETIDHELEAYLEEKRSGKPMRFDHSVDDQLSHIRAKFGTHVKPTKESEKPRIVEEVRRSHHDPTLVHQSPAPPSPSANKYTEPATKRAALSHDELIRSLEEKYSRSASVASGKTQNVPASQASAPEAPPSSLLITLRENIEPLDPARVDALLQQALVLDSEKQQEILDTFLARCKRNKERHKLFEQTQAELENELDRFIQSAIKRSANKQSPPSQEQPERTKPQVPPPHVPSRAQTSPASSTQEAPKASLQKTQRSAPHTPSPLSTVVSTPDISEKFKTYLLRLPKKPTVLMYDPIKGFMRKAVDPSDSSLELSYSTDPINGLAVLSVRDTRGNELGVFKFSQSEVGV
jgi:hypothetical protein